MFEIRKNRYSDNGTVIYRDEEGNEVFCKRTEKGFTAKLRPINKDIKVAPRYVEIPVKDTEGHMIDIEYPAGFDVGSLRGLIGEYSMVIEHWINMCYDLEMLQMKKNSGQRLEGDIAALSRYPELKPVIEKLKYA